MSSASRGPAAAPADPAPGTRVWYRSLYWRIALGLIAFLALALAAQGLLFIWMTDRIAGSMPARSPRQLAFLVASDVASALERDRSLDLQTHVRDQYGRVFQPVVVLMRDGRAVANRDEALTTAMEATLREELRLRVRRFERRAESPRAQPAPRLRPGDAPRRQRPRVEFAPILVEGLLEGVVAVPVGRPPFWVLVRELGPTMALVGGLVLVAGGTVVAFVVFGPARRRLREVQHATERLGRGDLTARAPAGGGDEVSEVARAFNRMADELAARAAALEASDRARRQLLADVSHELMTPLTAMRGYIETLTMEGLPLDAATRERYLHIVDDETRRLERLIGDLLDLARLEGGGTAFSRERVDVHALFERVASRHEREIRAHGITLVREIHAGAETVPGDPDRLEQVLQNLAANALRHTPDHGRITLSASRTGDRVTLAVRDTGPGIPPEHLPLIFDRFYKADASRRAAAGSGLGLSIARAIVERHGGVIEARNDGGAVFEVTLPAE